MSIARPLYHDMSQVMQLLRSLADREIILRMTKTVLVVVVGGGLAAVTPLTLKSLVDALDPVHGDVHHEGRSTLLRYSIEYLVLLFSCRILTDVRPMLNGTINQGLHSRLSRRFFGHVLTLPMSFLVKRKSGELLHSLDLASAGVQLMVTQLTSSLLQVLVEVATMISVLVHLGHPALVMVFSGAALAYLAIFAIGARQMSRASQEVADASLENHSQLSTGLAHFETLRYFAAERQAIRRFSTASRSLEERWRQLHRLNSFVAIATSVVFAVSTAACLRIGVGAVADGAMTSGGFVLMTIYMLQMVQPLESLGTAARDLSKAMGYMRPFLSLLLEPVASAPPPVASDVSRADTKRQAPIAVRFEDVHFGYDSHRPILRGVDLEVRPGCTMAIVGRSGAGKSSLVRLLMGLYAPQQGRVLLDGRAIETIDAGNLRGRMIGLVPQETTLMHESIAANIALGMPSANAEDVREAATAAQLQPLIESLPAGLATQVGERGLQLSGGERQRIGIARALLRRPGLYVLDEPTSSLDGKTELEVQKTVRSLSSGATTIVIAHRLATIVHADEIVVLEDGQIRERGTHADLLARNGVYARMWRQQTSGCM